MADRNKGLPVDQQIHLRFGINVGDVLIDEDDICGDGVNVAARLEALAEPGGICLSARVYDYVRDRVDVAYEDLGNRAVKNIAEPVHVYRIRLGEGAAAGGARGRAVTVCGVSAAKLAGETFSVLPKHVLTGTTLRHTNFTRWNY
jgi:class 3 adenylate cyclase